MRKTRLNEFMEGFGIITGKLKEIYQMNNRFFFSFYSPILSFLRILNSWPGYDVDRESFNNYVDKKRKGR